LTSIIVTSVFFNDDTLPTHEKASERSAAVFYAVYVDHSVIDVSPQALGQDHGCPLLKEQVLQVICSK